MIFIMAELYRLFANVQFADPNIYSRQDDRHDFLSRPFRR